MRDTRRTRLVLVLLLLTALALITIDYRQGSGTALGGLRSAATTVVGPIQRGAATVFRPIGNGAYTLTHPNREKSRAEQLQRQNEALTRRVSELEDQADQSDQLKALTARASAGGYAVTAAHVIAVGGGLGPQDVATLDVGSNDRVTPDLTVMTGDGLVGRVTAVTPTTCSVRLLVDPGSSVGARLESSRVFGLATGAGGTEMTLQLRDDLEPIKVGDRVLTTGSLDNRPYVRGVPIGVVTEVTSQRQGSRSAVVRTYVTVNRLDVVGVVVPPFGADPGDAMLPSSPDGPPASGPGGG